MLLHHDSTIVPEHAIGRHLLSKLGDMHSSLHTIYSLLYGVIGKIKSHHRHSTVPRLDEFKKAKLNPSSNKPAILPRRLLTRAYFDDGD